MSFSTAAASTSSTTTSSAIAASATTSSPNVPAEYATLDVRAIVQKWYRELAADARDFEKQAGRVFLWDEQLRDNQRALEGIVDQIHGVMVRHDDLRTACDTVESYQVNLENDLERLAKDVERELEVLQLEEPREDDYEREQMHHLSERLEGALGQMEIALAKLADNFSQQQQNAASGDDDSDTDPVKKVLTVLNQHHDCLMWLDNRSKDLQMEIDSLSRKV